jgi:hypothetical protein
MNIKQERTLSMQLVSIIFLDDHSAKTATIPNFAPTYAAYQATVAQIKSIAQQQSTAGSKDKTLTKTQEANALILRTMQYVNILQAHFQFTNNITHTNALKFTISALRKLADNNLVNKCQEIHDIANSVIIDLAPYGIDLATLAKYQTQINDYDSITATPRIATVNQNSLTTQLLTLFDTAKIQLDRITTLIKLTQYTDPVFFASYHKAIKILDTNTSPIDFRFFIKDLNNQPLDGFTLTLRRQSNGDTTQYKSNKNGIIQRRHLPEGIYEVAITQIDYAPLTGKIAVLANKTYHLEVTVDTTTKTFKDGRNPKTGEAI